MRPAATVVLVRPSGRDFEILLLKRHARSGFMANAYVFPGGRVDEDDGASGVFERLAGVDLGRLGARMGLEDSGAGVVAHLAASIRETFEEAGLLLASRRRDGELPSGDVLAGWRAELNEGSLGFEELLGREDLSLDGGALHYFAHWVTPSAEPKRYDTRFFLAAAPPAQEGEHDGRETTDTRWMTPRAALEAHASREMMLAPPTWTVLGQLAALHSVEDALAWAAGQAVETIQPTLAMEDGCLVIALPGDPLHEQDTGTGAKHRRVVLRDGRWSAS